MKHSTLVFRLWVLLLISATACKQQPDSTSAITPKLELSDPTKPATTKAAATATAIGRWRLTSIYSPWTNQTSSPAQPIELAIDEQLQATYYEDGKIVSRYQYVLREVASNSIIRYSVTNQNGRPTIDMQTEGNFRVSDRQLIIGDTSVDGPDYTFERL